MARPRKWENDSQRREAQNDRRKVERKRHPVDFIAVDGEGIGKWRQHKYVLLGVGDNQYENGGGLRFTEIMNHLYGMYQENPKSAFVGFFLGYDFTQWFKTLPEERAKLLLTDHGRKRRERRKYPQLGPFPVEYEGWEFDILGMKRFKLRETGKTGWMYVNDAGSFFQASLLSVIDPRGWTEPVVTEVEYELLEEGKKKRDSASLDEGMRRYNVLENAILARLMDRLNTGLSQAGICLKKNQWFGPGQAAQSWLSQIKAPSGESIHTQIASYRQIPDNRSAINGGIQSDKEHDRRRTESRPTQTPTELSDAGRSAYYGGWFEIMAHGHIPGHTWEYDINSAYPYIISRLPCLIHGTWKHGGTGDMGRLQDRTYRIVRGLASGSNKRIGTMLHRRDDHSICRPYRTAGWYWQHEVDAATRAGLIDSFECWETWTYEACGCRPPLRGIAGLYDQRTKVGKNTPHGKALKLVYNSVYGKFAQSVGNPKYGNAFYASLITAGCRTMILEAIASHPNGAADVVMVATDGVYFRNRHPTLHIGGEIGAWEEQIHDNLTLFKPGVYWDNKTREAIGAGDDPAFKARGISAKDFAGQIATVDDHFSQWPERYPSERDPEGPREGWYPSVSFQSSFAMVTCQQALQRGKWFLAGAVGTQKLTQDADPIGKRHSGSYEGDVYWSTPYKDGGPHVESVAYDRKFGQPDPEEYGINDDGTVKDQWAKMIMAR
jgi:hypothetical protein